MNRQAQDPRARFPDATPTPRGPISSRELRWIAAGLVCFWLVLIFGVPALLNWLLPRLAA